MSSEPNSLGLDFDKATISTPDAQASPAAPPPAEPTAAVTADAVETPTLSPPANDAEQSSPKGELKDKKKPYNNPDRVNTGGSQRDKLSDDALAERMARIREQNEKIRQRKLDVQADEDAFKKTQQVEAAKREKNKKVQENINRAREQNAQRKMAKVQGREWDAGKKGAVDWKEQAQQAAPLRARLVMSSRRRPSALEVGEAAVVGCPGEVGPEAEGAVDR